MLATRVWAWAGAGSGVVFLLVLADVLAGGLAARNDAALAAAFKELPGLVGLSMTAHWLGGKVATLLLVVGASVALVVRGKAWVAMRLVVVLGAVEVLTDAVKLVVARERPLDGLVATTSMSFPSGHASAAAALAVLVLWAALVFGRGRPRVAWAAVGLAALWAGLSALSRLVLGVHWPTDVVAGLAWGVAIACAGLVVVDLAEERMRRRRARG